MVSASENLDPASVARLCVEHWKLIRSAGRAADALPEREGQRLAAQVRFADRQLATLMDGMSLRAVTFEGTVVEPGLAASIDNAEDFDEGETLVVLATIEPAILLGARMLSLGRVVVGPQEHTKQDGHHASGD